MAKRFQRSRLAICFSVRLIGLEPTRQESLDPKSSASTNSATSADNKYMSFEMRCKGSVFLDKNQIMRLFFLLGTVYCLTYPCTIALPLLASNHCFPAPVGEGIGGKGDRGRYMEIEYNTVPTPVPSPSGAGSR